MRIAALVSAMMFATSAFAQQVTGTVTGAVTDSSGAAVASVELRLSNTLTGQARNIKSGEDGTFRFLVLQPGIYRLYVTHAGFKAARRDNIVGYLAGRSRSSHVVRDPRGRGVPCVVVACAMDYPGAGGEYRVGGGGCTRWMGRVAGAAARGWSGRARQIVRNP